MSSSGTLGPVNGQLAARVESAKAPSQKELELRKVAKEFEAVFLRQILASVGKATHASAQKSGDDGGVYGSLVVGAMADAVAAGGGMGLADVLVRSLIQGASAPSPSRSGEIVPAALKGAGVAPFTVAEPAEVVSTDPVDQSAASPAEVSVRRER